MARVIRVILSDLGNVVVTFKSRREVLRRIMQSFGHPALDTEAAVERLLPKIESQNGGRYSNIDTGRVMMREVWRNLLFVSAIDALDLPYERFICAYTAHLTPIVPVIEWYRSLQPRYGFHAVSDCDVAAQHILDIIAIHHGFRFNGQHLSFVAGVKKPELLRKALCQLETDFGILPDECVYIDDLPNLIQEGARMGVKVIEFNASTEPVENLVQKLAKHGVR